ncbi:Cupredoxin [Artemisia annua]|uniref:Cupredoxin n=1 Tax=Artemisia annua TaxID=35608 RepID=A0A2U1QN11_ARTAN|nr:Cupredoxin [Artemisia annua]
MIEETVKFYIPESEEKETRMNTEKENKRGSGSGACIKMLNNMIRESNDYHLYLVSAKGRVDPLTHNLNPNFGTKLFALEYGTRLEIVLQDTSFLNLENHPIHIHGHNFFIVGTGFGNYDVEKDTARYNLVDPPERNTVGVPMGGWAAIRINADNPGVWFMHCHLEEHTSWGLASGFIVKSGTKPTQRLLPPPEDLPAC